MIRKFLNDRSGNYALMTVITMVPLMGALALGIDYTDLTRQRQDTINALDAAGLATARRLTEGATDQQAIDYANQFFRANLKIADADDATLAVLLPSANTGGGTLKLTAQMTFQPYFLPVASWLIGKSSGSTNINFNAVSEVRLKNTLEVALVLDNSGSMLDPGKDSSKVRFDLLKDAATQLVDQLAGQAKQMKQIQKPVQFSLVPFAASVNVGPDNATESWMDTTGVSPIHHENLDWSTLSKTLNAQKYAEKDKSTGIWYARGTSWDATQKDKPLTRFSLYNLMQRVSKISNKGVYTYDTVASWGGCVEARPSPYDVDDTPASTGTPATMFVPMFAPDETDSSSGGRPANNNWHLDANPKSNQSDLVLQKYVPKYFNSGTSVTRAYGMDEGPNMSCSTTAITPLTDVSTPDGLTVITKAIDNMVADGATNVPEGMAWGWRTLSSAAPFTGGRSEVGKGNDKVLIVLTDGANTYYTPDSVQGQSYSGSGYTSGANDLAGNKSIYSALGYAAKAADSIYSYGRIFLGTSSSVSKTTYTNANYTKAMNEHFTTLCNNAKANNLIVMTIALDLDKTKSADLTQMNALKACASDSRVRRDETDPTKPAKLFWNSTGKTLSDDFKQIGNELSNLRIVS
ncbi:MAG TPA: TadE/TadG family type IV pilus assembly protein [Mesorhizobium sp.]|jgi:Flp pilus assembly protein TadG